MVSLCYLSSFLGDKNRHPPHKTARAGKSRDRHKHGAACMPFYSVIRKLGIIVSNRCPGGPSAVILSHAESKRGS